MKDAAATPPDHASALPPRRNRPSPKDTPLSDCQAHGSPSRPSNSHRRWPHLAILALLLVTAILACRSSTEPDPADGLTLSLDAVPLLVKAADTLDVATIWATVLEYGEPVRDSTLVSFVASNGKIESRAWTRDGLAQAIFHPGAQPGVASVVAQVRAVRDTVLLTVY